MSAEQSNPRIESVKISNYRSLRDVELTNLTPLTALIGPNGSGKSTFFDVFAFLAECFSVGLRKAWNDRGRFKELRSRNAEGPIHIEIRYKEQRKSPVITYGLSIDERVNGPYVQKEYLRWRRGSKGKPYDFLSFENGSGKVIEGKDPLFQDQRIDEQLAAPDVLAVNTLGQISRHPRVVALRNFITDWHMSNLKVDLKKKSSESGPQEHLSQDGDNLSNVIQFLYESHPQVLERIYSALRERIPHLERVLTEVMPDGHLLLQIQDRPFKEPTLARFASDGTIKLLAYLTLLYDPDPHRLIGIEEPENYLHPRLLRDLAEECQKATLHSQLFVTTHSPFFVNALKPKEVWVIDRDESGFAQVVRTAEMPGVQAQIDAGGLLGDLWMEGFFSSGDPKNRPY